MRLDEDDFIASQREHKDFYLFICHVQSEMASPDAQGGERFSVYTEAFEGRVLFELLQRKNAYAGYGAANLAVRLAAMAKSRSGAVRQAKL
mgnify:CR=1 FL=1